MSDLLRPGAHRAATHLDDSALLRAMLRVEQAWLDALVSSGVAPQTAACDLTGLVEVADLPAIARAAETGGNPVIPLVALLRERSGNEDAAAWLHRGLTSQDVLDTALALECSAAVTVLRSRTGDAAEAAARLTRGHRHTQVAGRTLTQYAVPVSFGLTAGQWLAGLLDAHDELGGQHLAVQIGGAAGTRSALVQLAGGTTAAEAVVARVAELLGLESAPPWHTVRTRWTRLADALVRTTDACGHVAADVLELSRSEVAEVAEASPGGSSTMPGKRNPVLATLVRAQALSLPSLAAQLHRCAADVHSQRPAGAWHAEWSPLRELVRGALVVVDQTADLLVGLEVDVAAMTDRVAQQQAALTGERDAMARLSGNAPDETYLGQSDLFVDAVLERARRTLGKGPA